MSNKNMLVCLVLDETGSMLPHKKVTISGYNEYINSLRKEKNFKFMLTRFNSRSIDIGNIMSISDAIELSDENYNPNFTTPLYDAIGKSIAHIEKLSKKKNILFVIFTDGEENSSAEYTRNMIFDEIKKKEKDGWTFVYLGANQDSYRSGMSLGIPTANTINYDQSNTEKTFRGLIKNTMQYSRDISYYSQNFWSGVEKDEFTSTEK